MRNEDTVNDYAMKRLAAFIRKFDRWMEICEEAKNGDYSRYDPRRRMPSKNAKHQAYGDAAYLMNNLKLNVPQPQTVDGLRVVLAAARAATT